MTENQARLITGESPTEHAAQILWFTGREKAKRMVAWMIGELTTQPHTFAVYTALAFWVAVFGRLGDGIEPLEPSPRRLAALKCIEERMR